MKEPRFISQYQMDNLVIANCPHCRDLRNRARLQRALQRAGYVVLKRRGLTWWKNKTLTYAFTRVLDHATELRWIMPADVKRVMG